MSWITWLIMGAAFGALGYYRKNFSYMASGLAAFVAGTLSHIGLTDSFLPYIAYFFVSFGLSYFFNRQQSLDFKRFLGRQINIESTIESGQEKEIELDHNLFKMRSVTGKKLVAGARAVIVAVKGNIVLVKAVDEDNN